MSIGKRIKAARREKGLTQYELANMTNMSRSHIAAIEVDAYNPSVAALERIAEVLQIPTGNLFDEMTLANDGVIVLNEQQLKILRSFDQLDMASQQRLLGYLDALLHLMKIKK